MRLAGLRVPSLAHMCRVGPLTVLAVGPLPTVTALAAVAPAPQDTSALIHAGAGFAEVDWLLGLCNGKRVCTPGSAWARPRVPTLNPVKTNSRPLQ